MRGRHGLIGTTRFDTMRLYSGSLVPSCVLSPRRLNFVVEPIDYFAQFQPRLMEARLDVFDRLASYL